MKRGIFFAPFEELSDPRVCVELAVRAEQRGWDGVFLWDHVAYREPVQAIADPWVIMAAIAQATSRVRIGALVTPTPRRRLLKLVRETATLDVLSGGRLIFGAGAGSENSGEFAEGSGEETDMRRRAEQLDADLDGLVRAWGGERLPRPLQEPRIPIWIAARWPNRRPVRRGTRWDGLFPIDLPGPEALAELRAEVPGPPFDLVVTNPAGADPEPWVRAGATWCLTGFGPTPARAEVEAAIDGL